MTLVAEALVPGAAFRKIVLEEAVATEGFGFGPQLGGAPKRVVELNELLRDVDHRIPQMDRAGIDIQVLSNTSPGVQGVADRDDAVRAARRSNDELAEMVARHPARLRGFASLATQDPAAAAAELRRGVTELGFLGALVNGQTNGRYLDDPEYDIMWAELESLGVPLYLHPGPPPEEPPALRPYPEWQNASFGWAVETAAHTLRIVSSGVFERFPALQLILGHLGEALPFQLWRMDERWSVMTKARPLAELPSFYLRRNVAITTAGVHDSAALRHAISAVGIDNVMFSIDYPFMAVQLAADFIESADVTAAEREQICSGNAKRLLRL